MVLATEIWGTIMCNHCIVFFSDNQAVVDIINKQTFREPKVMILVRRLVLNCLKYNILFKSKHIPGILNRECDLLSRLQVDKLKLLAPHADVQPTPVLSSGNCKCGFCAKIVQKLSELCSNIPNSHDVRHCLLFGFEGDWLNDEVFILLYAGCNESTL